MFVFKLSIVSLGISMYQSAFSILEFGQNSIVVATVEKHKVYSLRRRQPITAGIDGLRNGSQNLVLISRRFAGIYVSVSDWLDFLRVL